MCDRNVKRSLRNRTSLAATSRRSSPYLAQKVELSLQPRSRTLKALVTALSWTIPNKTLNRTVTFRFVPVLYWPPRQTSATTFASPKPRPRSVSSHNMHNQPAILLPPQSSTCNKASQTPRNLAAGTQAILEARLFPCSKPPDTQFTGQLFR